jgi:hypothetical protein
MTGLELAILAFLKAHWGQISYYLVKITGEISKPIIERTKNWLYNPNRQKRNKKRISSATQALSNPNEKYRIAAQLTIISPAEGEIIDEELETDDLDNIQKLKRKKINYDH